MPFCVDLLWDAGASFLRRAARTGASLLGSFMMTNGMATGSI